jgi:hypothetical protein
MNQRITELAQAATNEILGVPVLDQKQFAELIVRECLAIVGRYDYSYHEADPLWETAQLIKQNFGIDHE